MEHKEHRRYPRKRVYIPVECTLDGATHYSHAWTLSGGGLFLEMPSPLAAGTQLKLRFCPVGPLRTIDVVGTVRYHLAGQGVGVEFTEIKPEHRRMIMLLIGHRMAEKCISPRVPLRVRVEDERGTVLGISRDISRGGMFIETKTPIPLDTDLKLRFPLDDGGPAILTCAQVRYAVSEVGIGVEFLGLVIDDRNRINTFVTKASQALEKPVPREATELRT